MGVHEIRAASRAMNRNRYSARERGGSPCLGPVWRRVFENSRADKRRGNPDRVQRQDEGKFRSRSRSYNERGGRRVLQIARPDKSDGAFMLRALRIEVDQLMPMG